MTYTCNICGKQVQFPGPEHFCELIEKPVNDEPVNDEPVNDEPVNDEPVNDEPVKTEVK